MVLDCGIIVKTSDLLSEDLVLTERWRGRRAMWNLYNISKICIASALLYCSGLFVSAFRVKLGTNDLNCVDVPLNPTHFYTKLIVALQ